jgi:glutamate synthase (NADPH/NADH) large chain
VIERHGRAFSGSTELPPGGQYQWGSDGEPHKWTPEAIAHLQAATALNDDDHYRRFAREVAGDSKQPIALRDLLEIEFNTAPIPLDEVEPTSEIVKRFVTGAMSFGSISAEAHENLAIAMNRIGGRSNSGEGGEEPRRFEPDENGDNRRSAIKQIASGRFGVTSHYLANADDLQIKVAQGAKPGEGGHLPGHKVDERIAKVRCSTPGVSLISPPPHHDIYSIEDLAQLIYDLQSANPKARVSVKLVSEVGVGTIAAGVAKAGAGCVVIAGASGGTGASPLSSIKHAGLPWELGLAETQQVLMQNDLRSRIRVQVDGGFRSGRDVVVAALLGAEEFGFATAPLIVSGCILLRKCHLNTCSVGVATQDPALREHFRGTPEKIVTYFQYLAEEVRRLMAALGYRTMDELIGQTHRLRVRAPDDHWKARTLDLSPLLAHANLDGERICTESFQNPLADHIDRGLIAKLRPAIDSGTAIRIDCPVRNVDRAVGTMLSYELSKARGTEGLPDGTIHIRFQGSAGQSFGAFLAKGITLELEGDANDYLGKGLSGGRIIVSPPAQSRFAADENIIVGNTVLYGATAGTVFASGIAGERFAVRNSGARAVVEGVGDHGCEYMTGGLVVVLGPTGRNFAAGMSGGLAYVFDRDHSFRTRCNTTMVELEAVSSESDRWLVYGLIEEHVAVTNSAVGQRILDNWEFLASLFVKVTPIEYKRALEERRSRRRRTSTVIPIVEGIDG